MYYAMLQKNNMKSGDYTKFKADFVHDKNIICITNKQRMSSI